MAVPKPIWYRPRDPLVVPNWNDAAVTPPVTLPAVSPYVTVPDRVYDPAEYALFATDDAWALAPLGPLLVIVPSVPLNTGAADPFGKYIPGESDTCAAQLVLVAFLARNVYP